MLTMLDNDIMKIEYQLRLQAAEMNYRTRQAQKGQAKQRKGFLAALWKNLPHVIPAKPALRTK